MTESVVVVTGSSEFCGWPVLEPHPDRRNRAEMRSIVCFIAAKVAIPPEFLLSSVVKDTEMTEKKEPHHPVMDDTALSVSIKGCILNGNL
jgi:hypothetical protein